MPKDEKVSSLINQLKDASLVTKHVSSTEPDQINIPKEELEQFVINNAGKLIVESFDIMANYKDMITTAPNSEDVSAYADLIKAATNTLESLNKIVVQDKRSNTSIGLKKMDLDSKKEVIAYKSEQQLLTASREEIFKKLMDDAEVTKVIDVNEKEHITVTKTVSSSDPDDSE